MEELVTSIRDVCLIEPDTVTTDGNYRNRINPGHRRFRAAKAAGLETVEILIREPEDELRRRQKSVISNVQREDVGPVEMAEALQAMLDEDDKIKSQDELSRIIGKDKTWVSGMLRILTLPIPLQRRVGSTQLSVAYYAMIRIAPLEDSVQQEQLVEMLLGGASGKDIRRHIEALKDVAQGAETGGDKARVAVPKPKRVYRTKYQATVIVQSTTKRITNDQVIDALQEALGRATNMSGGDEET